ncbi:MAG: Arc family DNA-binding protein [Phascolarctobacterium sp.]|nr:Arc family DNA-binding protein [Phascolarctobacterium sp.]
MEEARFTLRIHPILMNKMKHIAKSNGRSVNKEIEQILKWVIDDYERKCGRIVLEEEEMTGKPKANKPELKPLPDSPMDMLFKLEK